VRALNVPVVAVLEHGVRAARGERDGQVELVAPADPGTRGHRLAKRPLPDEVPRESGGYPADRVIQAGRGICQVSDRIVS
jgi:hypothetical protein